MKLIGFSGNAKKGTVATLTHIDPANKVVHFVIGEVHAEYKFEGEAIVVPLLTKMVITEEGEVLRESKVKAAAKKVVKAISGPTGESPAYNKHY